jgi:hypothetical protein
MPSAATISLEVVKVDSPSSTWVPQLVPVVSFDGWRTHVPLPSGHVPRYVLLSVFLI